MILLHLEHCVIADWRLPFSRLHFRLQILKKQIHCRNLSQIISKIEYQTFFSVLQPLDEFGHLFQEHGLALDRMTFLVPL
jgi:hypothetical protein